MWQDEIDNEIDRLISIPETPGSLNIIVKNEEDTLKDEDWICYVEYRKYCGGLSYGCKPLSPIDWYKTSTKIDKLKSTIKQQQKAFGEQKLKVKSLDVVKSHNFITDKEALRKRGIDAINDMMNRISNLPHGEENLWDWNKVAEEIKDSHEEKSQPCKHEWVNAGFHFDKWVCKKCDVNKGSNE